MTGRASDGWENCICTPSMLQPH